MIKVEKLFLESQVDTRVKSTGKNAIPVTWRYFPEFADRIDEQTGGMIERVPNCIPQNQLFGFTEKALNTQTVKDTLEDLFSSTSVKAESFQAIFLQAGEKAFILACEVSTNLGTKQFSLYISRGPAESEFGSQAQEDFNNLTNLNQKAAERLTQNAARKYKFLKPMHFNTGEIQADNGHAYPFFTMPFIDDYAELRADVYRDFSREAVMIPYYRIAFSYNQQAKEYNHRAFNLINKLSEELISLKKRFPNKDENAMLGLVSQSESFQIQRKQMGDVLVGNALIYLLSDGYFPKEFYVNAGDWMVQPSRQNTFNLQLITTRGGLEYLGSDEVWVQRMVNQNEPFPELESKGLAFPLFYFYQDMIPASLNRAKRMIK